MINAKFKLITLILDYSSNQYKILSLDKDNLIVPFLNIEENLDVNLCLSHLVSSYIDKEDLVCNFKLTDIVLSDTLEVYYIVFISCDPNIKNSHLLKIEPITFQLPNNAQKILSLL